jgi:hypothetical protein
MAVRTNRHAPRLVCCFHATYGNFSKGGFKSASFFLDLQAICAVFFLAVKASLFAQFTSRGEPVDRP